MAGEFIIKHGSIISGSLEVTGGITGSFGGSVPTAETASYVNPLTQSLQVSGSIDLTSGDATTPVVTTINNPSANNDTGEGIIQFRHNNNPGSRIIGGRDNVYGGASTTWRGNIKLQTAYNNGWQDGMKIDWYQNVTMYRGLTIYQASTATYLKVKATNYNSPVFSLLTNDGGYGNPQIRYAGGLGLRFISCNYDETNQVIRMQMRPNGNIQIGTTSDSGRLTVRGSGTTSSTTALLVENSNASTSLEVKDDGELNINTTKYSNNGVLTNNGGVVEEVAGWTGIININTTPPIAIDVQNGIIVNVT